MRVNAKRLLKSTGKFIKERNINNNINSLTILIIFLDKMSKLAVDINEKEKFIEKLLINASKYYNLSIKDMYSLKKRDDKIKELEAKLALPVIPLGICLRDGEKIDSNYLISIIEAINKNAGTTVAKVIVAKDLVNSNNLVYSTED